MNTASDPLRARIVAAAERAFLQLGFSRVPMDDLARELGMSKKTLYAHFSRKEELVRAVLLRRVERMDAGLEAITRGGGMFPARFRHLVHFLHDRMAEINPVFLEDLRRHAPECFRIVESFRARAIPRHFGGLIDDGIRSGHLRSDMDRNVLLRMLLAAVQGIVRPEVIAELGLPPSAVVDHILSIVFEGVLTARGRELPPILARPK